MYKTIYIYTNLIHTSGACGFDVVIVYINNHLNKKKKKCK